MNYIFDANALIAYLEHEPGAEYVDSLIKDPDNTNFVHAVNFCEVYYGTRRDYGEEIAAASLMALRNVGLIICDDMDEDFWRYAGAIKADYKRVSIADCFCIALANRLDGEVVTSDRHEIEPLADAGICRVRFIR